MSNGSRSSEQSPVFRKKTGLSQAFSAEARQRLKPSLEGAGPRMGAGAPVVRKGLACVPTCVGEFEPSTEADSRPKVLE